MARISLSSSTTPAWAAWGESLPCSVCTPTIATAQPCLIARPNCCMASSGMDLARRLFFFGGEGGRVPQALRLNVLKQGTDLIWFGHMCSLLLLLRAAWSAFQAVN